MKIEQDKIFRPITITLEEPNEAQALHNAIFDYIGEREKIQIQGLLSHLLVQLRDDLHDKGFGYEKPDAH